MKTYRIHLIRHGMTEGNQKGLYIGRTDLPVTTDGINTLRQLRTAYVYPAAALFYSSPMLRCRQTLEVVYPDAAYTIVPGLVECDFGEFEGKTAAELENDPDFAAFLAGTGSPRGGEDTPSFLQRSVVAFHQTVKDVLTKGETDAVICTHGGVIMAIMEAVCLERREFYEWSCGNGEGYTLRITPGLWMRSGVAELAGLIPYERADGK